MNKKTLRSVWPAAALFFAMLVGLAWQEPQPTDAETPPIRFADELEAVVQLARKGEVAAAQERVEKLLEQGAASALSERQRAEAHYTLGVLQAIAGEAEALLAAPESFLKARALAGPGQLRLDAGYDVGWSLLTLAEASWVSLQNLLQAPPAAGALPGGAGQPAGATPEEAPDPEEVLETTRILFRQARAAFVERLRADWRDADTRANLELIQRRLRQLDELEEQQQEEEQQQQDDSEGEGEPEDGENEGEQESSDSESGEEQEQEGGESETDPKEGEPQDQEGAGEGEQDGEPEEVPRPDEDPSEGEGQEPQRPQERHLTKEEVMRLLDRLKQLEEEGQALQRMLREARRVPVERDW